MVYIVSKRIGMRMAWRQTAELVAVVGMLAGAVRADEPTKVVSANPQYETIDGRIGGGIPKSDRKPDAELIELVGHAQEIEQMVKEGKYDDVLSLYKNKGAKALTIDPSDLAKEQREGLASILDDISSAVYAKGQIEESIRFSEASVKLNPNHPLGVRNLAVSYKIAGIKNNSRGLLLEAIGAYGKLKELDPSGKFGAEASRMIALINNKYLPVAK